MILRFLTSIAAPTWSFHEGQVIEVIAPTDQEQDQIKSWLDNKVVEVVKSVAVSETATLPDEVVEQAIARRTPPGRRNRRRRKSPAVPNADGEP